MKIYTGSHENCKVTNAYFISDDMNKFGEYGGRVLEGLAPKKSWWQTWHDQRGVLSEEESLRFYVESYYETVLKALDPSEIISKFRDGDILLSDEEPDQLSPRHLVAAWLELFYGIDVREVCIMSDGKIKVLPRNKYYSMVKSMLEDLIKNDMDMGKYTAISAAYAYQVGLNFLKNAKDYDKKIPVTPQMCFDLAETLEKRFGAKTKTKD